MTTTTPIHPISKNPLIPVILTHGPTGTQQTYWISLKRFMEEREKGIPIRRIQQEDYTSVKSPGKEPEEYEIDFIENLGDFREVKLQSGSDTYTVKLISKVEVEKNGKPFFTKQLKVDTHKIARAILEKILG